MLPADCTEMFEFVEETLDGIALPVKPAAEGRWFETIRHGADISPSTDFGEARAQGVRIISPIRQENASRPQRLEHILGAPAIVGLACGKLQNNGQPHGIDEGVDLGRQAAPRAAHATGSESFFLPFAAC